MIHRCEMLPPTRMYGGAIRRCQEDEDGTLWVDNGEYASQVNYCPFCGYQARVQVLPEEEERDRE